MNFALKFLSCFFQISAFQNMYGISLILTTWFPQHNNSLLFMTALKFTLSIFHAHLSS